MSFIGIPVACLISTTTASLESPEARMALAESATLPIDSAIFAKSSGSGFCSAVFAFAKLFSGLLWVGCMK